MCPPFLQKLKKIKLIIDRCELNYKDSIAQIKTRRMCLSEFYTERASSIIKPCKYKN